jgi:hypothetical protein
VTRRNFIIGTSSLNCLSAASDIRPLRTIKKFRTLAIAPSGKHILGASHAPGGIAFRLSKDGWKQVKGRSDSDDGIAIQLLDPKTGETTLSCPGYQGGSASFFVDSEDALVACVERVSNFFWVRLNASQMKCERISQNHISEHSYAVVNGSVLVYSENKKANSGLITLYSESGQILKRVESVPDGFKVRYMPGFIPVFSAHRRSFLHQIESLVIHRSAEDLSVKWQRTYNLDSWVWANASFCPVPGGPVAILQTSRGPLDLTRRSQVVIVDPSQGNQLSTIPVDFSEYLAISADGKRIAVATRRQTKAIWEEMDLIVKVYSTTDGKLLGELHHDRVPRHQGVMDTYWHREALGFTRDNQFLISSGRNTKIWRRDLL